MDQATPTNSSVKLGNIHSFIGHFPVPLDKWARAFRFSGWIRLNKLCMWTSSALFCIPYNEPGVDHPINVAVRGGENQKRQAKLSEKLRLAEIIFGETTTKFETAHCFFDHQWPYGYSFGVVSRSSGGEELAADDRPDPWWELFCCRSKR